jgi:hypothetical protein
MTRKSKKSLKTDLERSALEMIRSARRLINIKKSDPLWVGTCKEMLKRLARLEKQVHKQRQKSSSEARINLIAKELAELVGNLCKSLMRYLYHFVMRCYCLAFS